MAESDDWNLNLIRSSLKFCPNFPKKGITFIDTFSIIGTPTAHRALIDLILSRIKKLDTKLDAIVGLEARGFVFGPQIALELQIPFIPVRKPGKLPGKVIKIDYDLEYGKDTIEMQTNVLKPGAKILLVDDVLATGGTLSAAQKLCSELGCDMIHTLVLFELINLGGRKKLMHTDHFTSLMQFSDAELDAIAAQKNHLHE